MKKRYTNHPVLIAITMALLGIVSVGFSLYCPDEETLHILNIQSAGELKDFFNYSEDWVPITMAHRGGAREGYPENAIETFENTLRHTWSAMEVDPRYTRDSVIVLFHDQTLERTSTGEGRVSDYTYEELREFKLKDPKGNITDYRIPTLSEALEWAKGKTILFLDDKGVSAVKRAETIEKHGAELNAVVMAYSYEDAGRVFELDPNLMIQVFIPDDEAFHRFDATDIPWQNVIPFVTHYEPEDENIFRLINQKGAITMIGTSRTLDREYTSGQISREELTQGYHEWYRSGANMIEADLGIELGKAAKQLRSPKKRRLKYFGYLKENE